jgi:hypothetical protein
MISHPYVEVHTTTEERPSVPHRAGRSSHRGWLFAREGTARNLRLATAPGTRTLWDL